MIEHVHKHITTELQQNTRTDTIFILSAILLNLISLAINSGFANSSRQDGNTMIIMFLFVVLVIVLNLVVVFGLLKGKHTRARLTQGLLQMYKDEEVNKYYDSSLAVNYNLRYNLFMTVVVCTGIIAIAVPFVLKSSNVLLSYNPDPGIEYNIIHGSSNYLNEENGKLNIKVASGTDNQTFTFIPVEGVENVYNIQVISTKAYITKDGEWGTKLGFEPNQNKARFTIEYNKRSRDIYMIKCLENNRYLGTDLWTAGAPVYSNKTGNNPRDHWRITEIKK